MGKSQGGKSQVGKTGGKKGAKPWEKMTQGKAQPGAQKNLRKKPVKEFRSFLYLLPGRTSAKDFAGALTFIDKKALEIWEEEIVLEITTPNGAITFEDIRDSLGKEDQKVLNDLRIKQVMACDYESSDAELVKQIMTAFLKALGGRIGSDTEDFQPFLSIEEL